MSQVLQAAIQSEVESRAWFKRLAERAGTDEARRKLLDLSENELIHRARLERRYRELVGEAPADPDPVGDLEIPNVHDLDLRGALRLALEHERRSESNYRFLAERASGPIARLYLELAENEWGHKSEIEAEYNRISEPDDLFADI